MRGFSKQFRRSVITATTQGIAYDIFCAEEHNKSLYRRNWEEYQNCLNEKERPIAVEAFEAHVKELNEHGQPGSRREGS